MLTKAVKGELKAIVGEGRYFDNPEDLLMYSYDAFMVKGVPEVVLLPVRTEEVSRIMKVASREKIPVTPRGAAASRRRSRCHAPVHQHSQRRQAPAVET